MPLFNVDPVVEVLKYAGAMWAVYGLDDPEQAIYSAAFTLYSQLSGHPYVAAEAVRYFKDNPTWAAAIKVAEYERRQDCTFGTTFV